MSKAEVVIAGGGFAGLVSAAACAARGMNVCVLEALSRPMSAFRGELLHPSGTRLLSDIGLLDALGRGGAETVTGFAVFDAPAAQPILLPYPEAGGSGLAMCHRQMLAQLRDRLKREPRVKFFEGTPVAGLVCDKQRVTGLRSSHGREFHGDVVIVADGRHSRLRPQLGIQTRSSLLSYTVALDLRETLLPHVENGHVFVGAPGPVLAYSYRRRNVRLCIDVPLGAPRGRAALSAYLRKEYAPHLPAALRAATLEALDRGSFELCANHAIATEACAVRGAALVGDAAGCTHPLTATGMPTTLLDAVTLAECLERSASIDAGLVAYQRRHYRFARVREVFAQALYDVFRGADPGAKALCDGVFAYWRRDRRARAASIRILCGEASGGLAFASQYARVLGITSSQLINRAMGSHELRLATPIGAVFVFLGASLRHAAGHAIAALQTELTERLEPPLERDLVAPQTIAGSLA